MEACLLKTHQSAGLRAPRLTTSSAGFVGCPRFASVSRKLGAPYTAAKNCLHRPPQSLRARWQGPFLQQGLLSTSIAAYNGYVKRLGNVSFATRGSYSDAPWGHLVRSVAGAETCAA